MTPQEARAFLAKEVNGNQKAWGIKHGMSSAYVSDAIAGRTGLGPKLLKALGLLEITTYEFVQKPRKRT